MSYPLKYVRLQGYAHIGVAVDGRLALRMCDNLGTPYPGIESIVFSFIPGTKKDEAPPFPDNPPRVSLPVNPPIKFLNIDMYAQFSEADFKRYQPLWDIITPQLTWAQAELPAPDTMDHMNPTGPPTP
ncbi:hypothetical protein [Dyadobacter sp. Leaf189]|uniref:hypothetical protein n=1 Tax=Dyadobacter sp. Leaf189 TaxID=1736295 RepID=UPI0006F1E318|nr:hypothetical protein [Dyadobacter sp. Leaf189]KQS33870.1 hypothetical protein ASG33_07455 [Dyadobacter sp. Leaf189]